MQDVYIIKSGAFLPNEPIGNDEIEEYMGLIGGKESRAKHIVLRNNGIKKRYYAMRKDGTGTHTNAQMAALSIRDIFRKGTYKLSDVDLICCGTSSPDYMMPSHSVMVHGNLPECGSVEVVSPSGNCCSGMHALKYAYMALMTGESRLAVTAGSERTSRLLHANTYSGEIESLKDIESDPYIAFEKDFLRWMLSDGAGAFLLSTEKNTEGMSLKIDWMEGVSYANEVEACMYMAAEKLENGNLKSFKDYTPEELLTYSILSIKQDVKLLSSNIVAIGFRKLQEIWERRNLSVDHIDYFLPHMSSEFFREKIARALSDHDMTIPQEKWYTNLADVGNVGAGSMYLMVDELLKSGKLKKGDKLLLAVPESARFSYVFAMLTVC